VHVRININRTIVIIKWIDISRTHLYIYNISIDHRTLTLNTYIHTYIDFISNGKVLDTAQTTCGGCEDCTSWSISMRILPFLNESRNLTNCCFWYRKFSAKAYRWVLPPPPRAPTPRYPHPLVWISCFWQPLLEWRRLARTAAHMRSHSHRRTTHSRTYPHQCNTNKAHDWKSQNKNHLKCSQAILVECRMISALNDTYVVNTLPCFVVFFVGLGYRSTLPVDKSDFWPASVEENARSTRKRRVGCIA